MQLDEHEVLEDLNTVRDFIRWIMSRMMEAQICLGHGYEDAWDEAVALVLHALHLDWDVDSRILDCALVGSEKSRVLGFVRARVIDKLPLAYLTRSAWLGRVPFYVDERVLIPRSPIAELIQKDFQPWIEAERVTHILDLCTGSGALAVLAALQFPEARVDAVDIAADALAVAEINCTRHRLAGRIQLLQADLFAGVSQHYDVILCNPPYVSQEEWQSLPKEFMVEPKLALLSGETGLEVVERILSQAAAYMEPGGVLLMEVGNSEGPLQDKYPEVPFLWLTFEQGGYGTFLLTREQLAQYQTRFQAALDTAPALSAVAIKDADQDQQMAVTSTS